MLGILEMDVETCITQYLAMAPLIFPEESLVSGSKFGKFVKGFQGKPRYNAERLETIIKGLVRDRFKMLGEGAILESMNDTGEGLSYRM